MHSLAPSCLPSSSAPKSLQDSPAGSLPVLSSPLLRQFSVCSTHCQGSAEFPPFLQSPCLGLQVPGSLLGPNLFRILSHIIWHQALPSHSLCGLMCVYLDFQLEQPPCRVELGGCSGGTWRGVRAWETSLAYALVFCFPIPGSGPERCHGSLCQGFSRGRPCSLGPDEGARLVS